MKKIIYRIKIQDYTCHFPFLFYVANKQQACFERKVQQHVFAFRRSSSTLRLCAVRSIFLASSSSSISQASDEPEDGGESRFPSPSPSFFCTDFGFGSSFRQKGGASFAQKRETRFWQFVQPHFRCFKIRHFSAGQWLG